MKTLIRSSFHVAALLLCVACSSQQPDGSGPQSSTLIDQTLEAGTQPATGAGSSIGSNPHLSVPPSWPPYPVTTTIPVRQTTPQDPESVIKIFRDNGLNPTNDPYVKESEIDNGASSARLNLLFAYKEYILRFKNLNPSIYLGRGIRDTTASFPNFLVLDVNMTDQDIARLLTLLQRQYNWESWTGVRPILSRHLKRSADQANKPKRANA